MVGRYAPLRPHVLAPLVDELTPFQRVLRVLNGTETQQIVLKCFLLDAAFNLFWILSLEGKKTPEEMNVTLSKLGLYLLLTEILMTSLLWHIFTHLRARRRTVALSLVVANMYLLYLYDHGNVLLEHGAFNMLCFAMIGVPFNLLVFSLYFWLVRAGSARSFLIQFAVAWVVWAIWAYATLRHAMHMLDVGFWGRDFVENAVKLPGSLACVWDKPVPWIDLLVVRQNFFLGQMNCPKLESFGGEIDSKTNILTITGCPADEETPFDSYFNATRLRTYNGPAVSYLPETQSWGFKLKEDSLTSPLNNFQANVISYIEAHTYAYSAKMDIGSAQTILIRCGTHEPKLVFRVTPAPPPAPATPSIPASANTSTPAAPTPAAPEPEGELSVLFIFMDAVSRRNFFRKLPRTVELLEKFTVPSSALAGDLRPEQPVLHQFFRYHAIGLNTGPNTRALWSDHPPTDSKSGAPPVWEDFMDDGYVTGRMDGVCEDWNAFYNTAHFPEKQSTYVKPHVTNEWLAFSCMPPYLPVGKGFVGNFAGSTSIKSHCLSGSHIGWHMLDWLDKFQDAYNAEKRKFFASGVFLEGHEGSTEILSTLDSRLTTFLDPATSHIDFNRTAVFLQADHGLHMGLNYIFTDNGHVEEVQPFSTAILPAWYLRKRNSQLGANEDRLVTAHDFWATMQGLRGPSRARKSKWGGRDMIAEAVGDRSCAEMGITEEDCRCKS
ncbi:hypothetical protein BDK51DRAFT_32117 [Blyttiomyces helicus]|uniref:Uncharacterized protein n=1 Tax=Blyttiomyces helicus TaxID=388810 RepID=A0A4V1IQA0_9FUNG|nr:hypothetical protein BDK51DRAFT_32117 [Blyttiomyces helicus]|eukprot:RKO85827.1 hypothetical protein BDK51DRAFT_32117 [Blyttiomyces helicus]